jgi:hypothetical protein
METSDSSAFSRPSGKREALLNDLFAALDGKALGHEAEAALADADRPRLLRAVAAHYRALDDDWFGPYASGAHYRALADDRCGPSASGAPSPEDTDTAARAVRGEVTVVNIPWRFPDGRIDYAFNPTSERGPFNPEWTWQLNRHAFWYALARVYRATGDTACAAAFTRQLLDWIDQTDRPADYQRIGSAWRTIETGIRLLGSWPTAFAAFRKAPEFTDEALCLMLASMLRQARHLVSHTFPIFQKPGANSHSLSSGLSNWQLMELNGLHTFASLFPEFREAEGMRRDAARLMGEAIRLQILPDGMQYELSPDYHGVVFGCAASLYRLARRQGRLSELPDDFAPLLRKAARAVVALTAPNLSQPRTNDCYTVFAFKLLRNAPELFPDDPEILWAGTGRARGAEPAGATASRFLPYAGFAAMRSGWDADATYCCFDVGPLGMHHIHQDMLNVIVFKGGEELLFDDGGGPYDVSDERKHAISAAGHNIALVDGLGQTRKQPFSVDAPIDAGWISTPELDRACATYDGPFGPDGATPARHTREVQFLKPDFFCVTDDLVSCDSRPHDYELLFHLDTGAVHPVPGRPGAVISEFGGDRRYDILIQPLLPEGVETSCVIGQREPRLLGWYVGRTDRDVHPAAAVVMKVSGRLDFRFATLLCPVMKDEPLPEVEPQGEGRFSVAFHGRKTLVSLPGRM